MPTVQELLSQNISNAQTNVKTWGPLMYNALEHGVKGDWDGVKGTDDTEAMQKLVNKAIAEGRKCIGLPHTPTGGMYYVTHLDDADQVVFVGDNASFVGGFTGTINQLGTFGVPQEEFDELKAESMTQIFNVKTGFGAVGDGVADDTAAAQDAINAAKAAGGGVVYFPRGIYLISTALKIPSNVTLEGAGKRVTFIKNAGIENAIETTTDDRTFYVRILGLTIDNDNKGQHGVYFFNTNNSVIRDCNIQNCLGDGVRIEASTVATSRGAHYNMIDATDIYTCVNGVMVTGTGVANQNDNTIFGGRIWNCQTSVNFDNTNNSRVIGPALESFSQYGVRIAGALCHIYSPRLEVGGAGGQAVYITPTADRTSLSGLYHISLAYVRDEGKRTVWLDYVHDVFAGRRSGSQNLLSNGNFERWSSPTAVEKWANSGGATQSQESDAYSGSTALRITPSAAGSRVVQNVSLTGKNYLKGNPVTIVGAIKLDTSPAARIRVRDNVNIQDAVVNVADGKYHVVTAIIEEVDAASTNITVELYPDYMGGTGTAIFDSIMLVPGRVPRMYEPRPVTEAGYDDDIFLTQPSKGLVVTTPDGTKKYRIRVDDAGEIVAEQVT